MTLVTDWGWTTCSVSQVSHEVLRVALMSLIHLSLHELLALALNSVERAEHEDDSRVKMALRG